MSSLMNELLICYEILTQMGIHLACHSNYFQRNIGFRLEITVFVNLLSPFIRYDLLNLLVYKYISRIAK
uniref:Uncharacterized protein n=1 Tax=Octopus bimaculoides TaxID=37653 RepID=A0A0L8FL45_OCTBM